MIQLDRIHGLIARTRGRMRRQAALEWGTTAFILALAGSLVVLWFWRMEYLSDAGGIDCLAGLGAGVVIAAIVGIGQADLDKNMMDADDAKYVREQYVDDLKKMAEQTGDPFLKKLAEQLEDLLDKAEKGEISKEELLAKMDELEKNYMDGSD